MKKPGWHIVSVFILSAAFWLIGPQLVSLVHPDSGIGLGLAKGGDDSDEDDSDDGDDNSGPGGGSDDDDDSGGNSGSGGGGDDDDDDDDNSGSGGGGTSEDDSDNSGSGSGNVDGTTPSPEQGTSPSSKREAMQSGFFVLFRDGHTEAIRNGIFLRLDRRGRIVDQRRATSSDLARLDDLRSAIRRSDDISTVAVVNSAKGLLQVIDDRGWTETVEGDIYTLMDPEGNRVTKRKATSRDRRRLSSALK